MSYLSSVESSRAAFSQISPYTYPLTKIVLITAGIPLVFNHIIHKIGKYLTAGDIKESLIRAQKHKRFLNLSKNKIEDLEKFRPIMVNNMECAFIALWVGSVAATIFMLNQFTQVLKPVGIHKAILAATVGCSTAIILQHLKAVNR